VNISAGSSRRKIIVGTTVSLSIFLILVFAAIMLWRYRAKQNGKRLRNLEAFSLSLSLLLSFPLYRNCSKRHFYIYTLISL